VVVGAGGLEGAGGYLGESPEGVADLLSHVKACRAAAAAAPAIGSLRCGRVLLFSGLIRRHSDLALRKLPGP